MLQLKRLTLVFVLAALGWLGAAMASPTPIQSGNDDWNIQLGAPHRSGEYKLTVKVTWTDSEGKKQKKTITSTTTITRDPNAPMTGDQKRAKIQQDLQDALNKPGNQIGGAAAANLSGAGSTINVDPNTSNTPSIKITSIKPKDDTGQEDTITPPSDAGPALIILEAEGSITGRNTRGTRPEASVFSVRTNLGTATVNLSGSMTKYDLLQAMKDELDELGVPSWLDSDKNQLILLSDSSLTGAAATTTDDGLFAVTTVMIR